MSGSFRDLFERAVKFMAEHIRESPSYGDAIRELTGFFSEAEKRGANLWLCLFPHYDDRSLTVLTLDRETSMIYKAKIRVDGTSTITKYELMPST